MQPPRPLHRYSRQAFNSALAGLIAVAAAKTAVTLFDWSAAPTQALKDNELMNGFLLGVPFFALVGAAAGLIVGDTWTRAKRKKGLLIPDFPIDGRKAIMGFWGAALSVALTVAVVGSIQATQQNLWPRAIEGIGMSMIALGVLFGGIGAVVAICLPSKKASV